MLGFGSTFRHSQQLGVLIREDGDVPWFLARAKCDARRARSALSCPCLKLLRLQAERFSFSSWRRSLAVRSAVVLGGATPRNLPLLDRCIGHGLHKLSALFFG